MELDAYIPAHQLAFEYQGEQHYRDIYALGRQWSQRERDNEKRLACEMKGITLVEIPYWWDREKSSLVATIQGKRPDLLANAGVGETIPSQPPKGPAHGKMHGFF